MQAASEANEWNTFSVPQKGDAGGWVLTSDVTTEQSGVTAICVARDGTIYAAAEEIAGSPLDGYNLFQSTDDGFTWESLWKIPNDDKPAGGPAADPDPRVITLVLPQWEDADTLFLATQYSVYKSTDGGEEFTRIAARPAYGSGADNTNSRLITSLDVTHSEGQYLALICSRDADAGDFGGAYIFDEARTFTPWVDIWAGGTAANSKYDVLDIAFSPNFNDDEQVIALITDETDTLVTTRLGMSDWGATVGDAILPGVAATSGSIAFPADYDSYVPNDTYAQYVGLDAGPASAVYMIVGTEAPEDSLAFPMFVPDPSMAVHSLVAVGEAFDATIVAGLTSGNVMYSDTSGAIWQTAHTPPSVTVTARDACIALGTLQTAAYVVYAGTSGPNSGFARSIDSGDTWSRTTFICDDLLQITDFVLSPNYSNEHTMYMTTEGNSARPILWYTDNSGKTWEAVLTAGQEITLSANRTANVPIFDKVALSRDFAHDTTVFVCDSAAGEIWRSTDNGFHFSPLVGQPAIAGNVDSWTAV
ncbi:hypothetical protein ACFLWY_05360, partial [Chloroflexota bacterium]